MSDNVIIRDGTSWIAIRLEMIHEWPMTSWKAAMRHMANDPGYNQSAAEVLSNWFPEACRRAAAAVTAASAAYTAGYIPLKQVAKDLREKQKYANMELALASREARNKENRLRARYLEFLAAKASMKKEN